MGLVVNEDKTKYLLSSNKQSSHSRLGSHVTVDGQIRSRDIDNFVYLETSINTKNNVSLVFQRRVTFVNRCLFGLSRQLKSKVLSRRTKTKLYKFLITPVLLYWGGMDNDNIWWVFEIFCVSVTASTISMERWAVHHWHSSANQETAAKLARSCCPDRWEHFRYESIRFSTRR